MIASILTLGSNELRRLGTHLDEYGIHKLVYSHFPGKQRHFLYADKGGRFGQRSILMLSRDNPVTVCGNLQTATVPLNYLEHDLYFFEVFLNPVVRKTGEKNGSAVTGCSDLLSWFTQRDKTWGFVADLACLEVVNFGLQKFIAKGRTVTYNHATFRGILRVFDRNLFKGSFENGIGRGKAFGFGLLQIKPVLAK